MNQLIFMLDISISKLRKVIEIFECENRRKCNIDLKNYINKTYAVKEI